ncbi:type VII secretion-associated serine protease mycosin [Mycobacterium vicinigordonae]|uniref:Type VII secretion-associated serine protease mycosin n=1 Tax=Mycobacterium vicinigordonae TaxID=1719132 RepID=A0A7D6IA15_9MYCO|nr:type VII secretion-associated serine protease mycosin [Mycobacterium vicinigordonae]QLL08397.1 type VII secretion-associated serine protease mycosin [Mycobacterium vicinigordonae]
MCTAVPAGAVTPPPVDERMLPAATSPAPAQRTVQREVCAAATNDPANTGPPAQLADLDLPRIWQFTRGAGQRVAVIDTGVRRHPRLKNLVAGGDYVSTGDGAQDCDAHGTLVAGIIAATTDPTVDKFGGVAPDVTLISIRQSSAKYGRAGAGGGVGDVQTLAKAVRTAADLGATVINISTVACVAVTDNLDDRPLGAALAYAVDVKNIVVVAAAGNTGGSAQCPPQAPSVTPETVSVVVSPPWYDDYVLTVGSVNSRGAPSSFTLAGPWVDVAATGEEVTSLSPVNDGTVNSDGHSAPLSGTSYAAPIVSGVAALIRARFPAMTAREVMQRIEATAHHPSGGWDPRVGHGTVDALAAIATDANAPESHSQPTSAAIAAPPAGRRDPAVERSGGTAFGGAAICLLMLLAVCSATLRGKRSAHSRNDGVAGD